MTSMGQRRVFLALGAIGPGLVSILLVSRFPETIIAGDPAHYRALAAALLDGGWPYLEVPFEHLPVMILPILSSWLLGGAESQTAFVFAFAFTMLLAVVLTALAMDLLGRRLSFNSAGLKWLLVTIPVFPLVLFRNDPVVVLLFVLAAASWVGRRRWWTVAAIGGALAKVWPAVLAVAGWVTGKRRAALLVAGSGLVALAMTLLPGFREARNARGLHAETAVGALVGWARVVRGSASGVEVTTAAYLPVSTGFVAINALIGAAIVGIAVVVLRQSPSSRGMLLATGAAVVGVILASQLFSLQYVLWLTPFIALTMRKLLLIAGSGLALLTTVLAWIWKPPLFEEPWFYGALSARNLLVLWIAWWLLSEARTADPGEGRVAPA